MSTYRPNPWPGLSSYPDPEEVQAKGQEPQLFCGRDNESYDVAQLIDDNIFVTLYGKSGTGKSSLLKAGVFPRLRKEQYLPVIIRLSVEADGMTFQKCIEKKLQKTFENHGAISSLDVVPLPRDDQSLEYLWSFFARTRFTNTQDQVLFPVLVFDQFEEILRTRRFEAEALLRQIHFMMDESHSLGDRFVNGQPYSYDFNYRFVISLREDDLYRLEDCIDNNYLFDMKRCRYRLRHLTEEGARDAILIPGEGLFYVNERHTIANTIINIARNKEDDGISALILSLICNRIFLEHQRIGAPNINLSLVDKFVNGNPFERFYNEATQGFSNREKSYIETNLVDSDNRRNSIPVRDFLLHVKNGTILFEEGNRKILQRISTSSDGDNLRVELIHDSFCEPLAGLKGKREKRRRLQWLVGAAAISLFFITVGLFMIYQNRQLKQSNLLLEEKQMEIDKLNAEKDQAINNSIHRSVISIDDLGFAVDGIIFSHEHPTLEEIERWKEKYHDKCETLIAGKVDSFTISSEMRSKDPCLIYLIIYARSLESYSDKQTWFDLYEQMTEEQINQLYDILYRETYKLAQIEDKYAKGKAAIKEKYQSKPK